MINLLRIIKQRMLDVMALFNFVLERFRKRSKDKIRVAFMCQYIPAWNKSQSVYERLKKDPRFEVYILCVPNRIENRCLKNPEDLSNDTYDYFISHGYDAVNTLVGENQWLDLKDMNLDYIFFTRPYNAFMPREYSTRVISRYSKICVLLYAMTLASEDIDVMLNRDFFRNVYCFFAEVSYVKGIVEKQFKIAHRLGLRKTVYHGMPALEDILNKKDSKNNMWDFSSNEFRVIWTPRWTTDPKLGGSNFFVYKEALLDFAKENEDVALLLRPHPLTFDNFIKTGEMTETEVKDYKKRIESMKNVALDEEQEYVATMWNSSVLISDYSGVIPEYFAMGKPLIYCASNMILEITDHFKRMLEGCYVVYNEEELFSILQKLKSGDDPLAGDRKKIARELFGDNLDKASELIVEELARE